MADGSVKLWLGRSGGLIAWTNSEKSAASSASTATPRPRISPTSASMRCSTAARRAWASRRRTARGCRSHKAMGYVADAFDEHDDRALAGTSAVGHVRYSTAGESGLKNAQPILIDCAHGEIAICHNGNLVNAQELRDDARRQGSIFQTTSDTEVLLHLYARSKAPTSEQALDRIGVAGAGRVLARAADEGSADRGARPARLPAAHARPTGRRLRRLLGDVRARLDRREVGFATSNRGRCSSSGLRASKSIHPFPPAPLGALHFRARLFRAPGLVRIRQERERSAHGVRAQPRARAARGRRRRRAGSRLGRVRGDGVRGGVGPAAADGAHPQSLRGPHVHRAAVRRSGISACASS